MPKRIKARYFSSNPHRPAIVNHNSAASPARFWAPWWQMRLPNPYRLDWRQRRRIERSIPQRLAFACRGGAQTTHFAEDCPLAGTPK
jgi:hypothetical protein